MTATQSPLTRSIQFLGKVKFTTVLLLGGAVIMILGTIVESRDSREAAWSAVYGTLWFDIFLLLLGINLILAVVNRFPIQRHHWPFVLTHFAIVLLLVGAWISATFGYEGRLVIFEGSQEHRLLMDALEIRTRWQAGTEDAGTRPADGGVVSADFPLPSGRRLAGRVLQEEGDQSQRVCGELVSFTIRREKDRRGRLRDVADLDNKVKLAVKQCSAWQRGADVARRATRRYATARCTLGGDLHVGPRTVAVRDADCSAVFLVPKKTDTSKPGTRPNLATLVIQFAVPGKAIGLSGGLADQSVHVRFTCSAASAVDYAAQKETIELPTLD